MAGNGSGSQASNVANRLPRLAATFRAVRMEHLFAGITGGVVSTLILHPLDLLKIRFAGKLNLSLLMLILNLIQILGNIFFAAIIGKLDALLQV